MVLILFCVFCSGGMVILMWCGSVCVMLWLVIGGFVEIGC